MVVRDTGIQLLILFGPLLLLSFIMHFISGWNEKLCYRVFGRKIYLYLFGWLGTSVHESGHALFALIFGHKILEMRLFSPDPATGTLGYVKHSWNRKNPYQVTGNFFIGLGPILLGSVFLMLITFLLYYQTPAEPSLIISPETFSKPDFLEKLFNEIRLGVSGFIGIVFSGSSSAWWKTILLVYVVFCIGSSIKLSSSDLKNASLGMVFFVVMLLLFNLATLWSGNFTTESFIWLSGFFSGFYLLIVISIVTNIVFIIILSVFYLVRKMLGIDV